MPARSPGAFATMVGKRFLALDSLRGVCALVVAFHHFPFENPISDLPMVANGYLFVDFFFVLSGFVISHAWQGAEPARFVWRRIARLWPLHLTMLAAIVAFEALRWTLGDDGFNGARRAEDLLVNLTLLHGIGGEPSWNVPSWTISVEMGLYLGFVAFLALPKSYRPAVACLAIISSLAVLAALSPNGMNATTDYGWARGLAGFYAGFLVRQSPLPATGTVGEIGIAGAVIAFVSLPAGPWHFGAPIVFAVAVAVFAHERGAVSTALTSRPLTALGRWSYSIYMTHYLVCLMLAAIANRFGWAGGTWALLSYPVIVIALSALTYRMIELPGQRIGQVIRARAS